MSRRKGEEIFRWEWHRKMITTWKAERKVINQFITVYQAILSFSIEKMGLEVEMKFNKQSSDDLLDCVNAHLIEVCEEYLETHKLNMDKFQLSLLVMDLFTQAISELDEPFRVTIRESKQLVQDYLEKNAKKRETLERIKKENEALDEKLAAQEKLKKEKRVALIEKVELDMKPEMPSGILEAGGQGLVAGVPKKKKSRWTDSLAVDNFYIPWVK